MEQDSIVAAILASALGTQGKFHDAAGAVHAYHAVLSALKTGEASSQPIFIGQDEGVPEASDTAVRNLHF